MNKFAQILYGKVLYIYETHLSKEELSTIFAPTTFWEDVTGLECEVGYLVDFKTNVGLVLTPPPATEKTFEDLKAAKLQEISMWTQEAITGGFISTCTGTSVKFDSDMDTQITMQGIALNAMSERFTAEYPQGCPCRGYAEGSEIKSIYMLTGDQVLGFCADLSLHIGACKQRGWILQEAVTASTTKEELELIVWAE